MKNGQSGAVLQRRVAILDAVLAGHQGASAIAQATQLTVRQVNEDLRALEQLVAVQRWKIAGAPNAERVIRRTSRTQPTRDRLVQQLADADDFWVPKPWVNPIRARVIQGRAA